MPGQHNPVFRALTLQAISLFITYVGVVWLYAIGWLAILIIAIPLFVISIFQLMRSGASLPVRLLLSFWPVTIPAGILSYGQAVAALQWRMVRTEVILIPAEYHGTVTVWFDMPGGVAPVRDGAVAVFQIPASGELRTRDHAPVSTLPAVNKAIDDRREFYFLDKSGHRTRIDLYRDDSPRDRTVIFWRLGNFEHVGGTLEESRYNFYDFYVGTPAQESRWW